MRKRTDRFGLPQPFLPRYRIISALGEGGVATVYKVLDLEEGSIKALKVLKLAKGKSGRDITRFEEEYRILRALHHPSLAEVYDYGITREEARYIVMEYVEGQVLDVYFRENKEDIWQLLYQLGEALAFIHEHGLLHLDLKPKNMLVRKTRAFGDQEKPQVMMLDFGVSYRRDSGSRVSVVGTPAYMAPEVIRGDDKPTRAVDYYSLGVTLYQLIEGKLPFNGTLKQVFKSHLADDPVFGESMIKHPDLCKHVEALMAKGSNERLVAFENFRSATSMEAGGELAELEKTYGMGYLNSLGFIGKDELWQSLKEWTRGVADEAKNQNSMTPAPALHTISSEEHLQQDEMSTPDLTLTLGKTHPALTIDVDIMDTDELRKTTMPFSALTQTSQLSDTYAIEEDYEAPRTQERAVVISGATGSGKTYIVDALIAELRINDVGVVVLGNSDEYDVLVSEDEGRPQGMRVDMIDPQSIIIDRFVRGWERLMQVAQERGMVLIVDGYDRVRKEEREFLEYVGRRLDLLVKEGSRPALRIVVTGRSPRLALELETSLPRHMTRELVIPPPSKRDVDAILERFHGHMPGVQAKSRLSEYLYLDVRSSSGLLVRLKRALIRGDLARESGQWRFITPTKTSTKTRVAEDYYHDLLSGLEGEEKRLVSWLACQRGSLFVHEFKRLTGMTDQELSFALQRIKAYRVVEVTKDKQQERIGLVNESVRQAFYAAIKPEGRGALHKKYIHFFSNEEVEEPRLYPLMCFHYEQVGETRLALEMRIRTIRQQRATNDVFGARFHCGEGIAFIRKLAARTGADDLWPLERYFIKQWMNIEWNLHNYKALTELIKTHITARNRPVPVSFSFKYGTALGRSGELKKCREFITWAKPRIENKNSQTYAQMLMIEADMLNATGAYDNSLRLLTSLKAFARYLSTSDLAGVYILYMLNYESLGNKKKHEHYRKKGEEIALKHGHYEHALTASYSKILSLLNSSQYQKARDALRVSLRVAIRHRVYRQLCSMYFMASGVYYEEGSYKRALKHLDKAVRVALNMGMIELVNDLMLRYALIHQNLGYYGNAIHYAETVKNRVSVEYRSEQFFYSLLILFDLHNSIHHNRAREFKNELDLLLPTVEAKYRLALYHWFSADYFYRRREFGEAFQEYKLAQEMYESIEYVDDAVRCALRVAMIHIDLGEFEKANKIVSGMHSQIEKMESQDLSAEFYYVCLKLHDAWQADEEKFLLYLKICEEIWTKVSDVNIQLKLNALLFKACLKTAQVELSMAYFQRYYVQIRQIANNLPGADYIDQFLSDEEFNELVEEYKSVTKEHPSQPVA